MAKGLVWFDCDGVLTDQESSWTYLHKYFGSKDNPLFAEMYRRGYISYLDWMKIDIAIMIYSYGKPITREEVEKALRNINVKKEAKQVVNELKKRGYMVGVISSGVDLLVKRVCREVGIDLCLYNELFFINNILIPGGTANVPLREKPNIIKKYSEQLSIPLSKTVYVGDSIWDIDVFKIVGVSIAVKPCNEACKYADYTINNLSEILEILR